MIQRIQTLFLIVAGISAIALFFLPVASFLTEYYYLKLYLYSLKNMTPNSELQFGILTVFPLLLVNLGILLSIVVAIFDYKNRIRQVKFVRLALFLSMLLMLGIFLLYPNIVSGKTDASPEFEIGAYVPIINLLFLFLANRHILKDERIVRSSSRLR
jgi:peptidoglycan/LPS O-acetylase OafA/YrhL